MCRNSTVTDEQHGEDGTIATGADRSTEGQAQEKAHKTERTDGLEDHTKQAGDEGGAVKEEGRSNEANVVGTSAGKMGSGIGSIERPLSLTQGTSQGTVPPSQSSLAATSRYHFGNYDRYYGYHSLNEFIDVRLKVFMRNAYLFRDKDVLDIGCNVGLMTIAIAKSLHTKSAIGIDVDGKLIAKARKNLAKYVRVPRTVVPGAGRRGHRESSTVVSATVTKMEVSEELAASKETLPLQSDPAPTAVSAPQPSTSQEGGGATEPSAATPVAVSTPPASVAETEDNVSVAPAEETVTQTVNPAATSNEDAEKAPPEPPANAVPAETSNRVVVRQKRRRKRFGQKGGRHGQHHNSQHHQQHQQHHLRRNKPEQSQYFPISFPVTMGNFSGKEHQMDIGRPENKFPNNVRFKTVSWPVVFGGFCSHKQKNLIRNNRFWQMNYVLKDEQMINFDTQQYDLILCLSVTKWIHLNYGDVGLKTAFKRMFNHLRPGGKLILEAQNWASYKKKKKLTVSKNEAFLLNFWRELSICYVFILQETIFENYQKIEFFPKYFHDYLLSPEVGFSHSFPLGIPRHLSKGFRRPIQVSSCSLFVDGAKRPNCNMVFTFYLFYLPRSSFTLRAILHRRRRNGATRTTQAHRTRTIAVSTRTLSPRRSRPPAASGVQ